MTFPCAVEHDLRRHEAQMEREDALGARVDSILASIVVGAMAPGAKYDPTDGENILEALGDADRQTVNSIGRFVAAGDGAALVTLLRECSEAYWKDYAEKVYEGDARNQALMHN